MKVILDSNIYIAAFSSRGLCSSLFELCIENTIIITSEFILSEVSRVFSEKIKLPGNKINDIIIYLREQCIVMDHKIPEERTCRDVNDDNVLELARESQADYIITGDKDLLVLKNFDLIPIITPREFWNTIRAKGRNLKL